MSVALAERPTHASANTLPAEREQILKEFRKPDSILRVLVSVEALAKGFDVPDVSCVIDCRPLRKSLSTAIQMWGRGLRASPTTGKTDCILLDHSGNITRFAEDFEAIFYNGLDALDAGEKLVSQCGGKASCGACHVFLLEGRKGVNRLTADENAKLDTLIGIGSKSRLACQVTLGTEPVTVELLGALSGG